MTDTVSTDFTDVLAATAHTVILRGQQYAPAPEEPVDCIVHVSRALYHSAVSAWLDQKAAYFELYKKEYYGVGTIEFKQLTRRPGRSLLRTADGLQNVLTYDAAHFVVDMERG